MSLVLAIALGCGAACARPAVFAECPGAPPGALVISELRGRQLGNDTYGQWVEIHNSSSSVIEIAGLTLRMSRLDGSDVANIVVRDRDLVLESQGYVVLGRFSEQDRPVHIDYGYVADFSADLYNGAVFELLACGEIMDQVVYRSLPDTGTWSYDGDQALTAESNDNEANWCIDETETTPGDSGITDVGAPGTPGVSNRPCI